MSLLVGISLATIAAIMFYRLVERRHKILIGKVLAGLTVLGAAVLLIIWLVATRQQKVAEELQRSVSIEFVRDSQYEAQLSAKGHLDAAMRRILGRTDTLSSISFRFCNRGKDSVQSVAFRPVTLRNDRSTEYNLVESVDARNYDNGELTSDFIIAPGGCSTITWSPRPLQRFVAYDTVVARWPSVTVRKRW